MRILCILAWAYPDNRPATLRSVPFIRALVQAGHEVTIAGFRGSGPERGVDPLTGALLQLNSQSRVLAAVYKRGKHVIRRAIPSVSLHPIDHFSLKALGASLLKSRRYDVIWTTTPPTSAVAISGRLSNRFKVPFILDARDLPDEFEVGQPSRSVRRRVRSFSRLIRRAAGMTTVSQPLVDALKERYRYSDNRAVITNGYDSAQVRYRDPVKAGKFRIGYFGEIYARRRIDIVLDALLKMQSSQNGISDIAVDIYGKNSLSVLRRLERYASSLPLEFHGQVSYDKAIEAMYKSSLLLNLASEGCAGILPTKLFEYAQSGRPVLSVPEDNDVIDAFVRQTGIGFTADDSNAVAEIIGELYHDWLATGFTVQPSRNDAEIQKFDRRRLATDFVDLFESWVDPVRRKS